MRKGAALISKVAPRACEDQEERGIVTQHHQMMSPVGSFKVVHSPQLKGVNFSCVRLTQCPSESLLAVIFQLDRQVSRFDA